MKNLKKLGCLIGAVTLIVFSQNAQAQKNDPKKPTRGQDVEERMKQRESSDQYRPRGARMGSFQLFPSVNLIEEYNDNIYAASSGEKSDFITKITPELSLESDFKNHSLIIVGGAEVARYASHNDDDHENFNFSADARIDASRALKFNLGGAYALDHEDRGSPDEANGIKPTEFNTQEIKAGLEYKPNRIGVSFDYVLKQADYDDVSTTSGITNNDDRDREKSTFTGRVGYEYLPDTEMFIRSSYNEIAYDAEAATDDNGEDRDSTGYVAVIGTGLNFTGTTTGEVFAGWMSQDYDDATLQTISGYTLGAGLLSELSADTSLRIDVGRTIEETTTAGSSGYIASSLSVSVTTEFLRNLIGRVKGKYSTSDYQGITKEDETFTGNVGVKYLVNRNFSTGLEYEYKSKDVTPNDDWTQNRIRLNIQAQF